MKTKYLLKLVALNLALTTVFAAAIPSPSPSQSGGGGGGEHYKSMIANLSSVKIIARMQEHEEARKVLDTLKKINDVAGKQAIINGMRESVPELVDAAAATAGAGASDEKIFDTMLDMLEKEYMEETLAIARDLHAAATPPAPGSRIH